MNNFKKLSLCCGLLVSNFISSDSEHEKLQQKVQFLQAVIADIMEGQPEVKVSDELKTVDLESNDDDHRMTLRIPKWLVAKIDIKRKQRVGKISRNLWILELIEKAVKK